MVQENTIRELVVKAQKGNTEAFGEIYNFLNKPVFNFLFARLRSKETAEDLLQTVFLKAWNNIRTYKPRANAKFSTWLFQIANFTLIDYWRVRKDTTDITAVENLSIFAVDPKLYERYDYLWQALKELPDEYQTVLNLRFQQDLPVSDVAEIMNKSEVGIRVLQHRAIKSLREKLSTYKNL